ncbi:MAG: putative Ig domain-containing protein, partial [Pyrinomonadaceae bacterium]
FVLPAATFADVDAGDTLNYAVSRADGSPLPIWLSFDPATRTLSGTPGNDDVGTLALKVTARDPAGASASSGFNMNVTNVNDQPTLASPIVDRTVEEESAFNFTVPTSTFADVDAADSFTFTASLADGSSLPAWLSFDPATRVFSGTPRRENVGTSSIRVTATDIGGLSVSDLFELTVTQAPSQTLTGSSGNDALIGGAGDDALDGGPGADTLTGKSGNDSYVVDNVSDVVVENPNEGTDTVLSSVGHTLSANVENLTLTGTASINGTGNSLNNILAGNSAANVLAGGGGNDTYFVGSGDTVIENANEGTDTVNSSVAYTLGANLENLTLTGTASIAGTGNGLPNVINGNTGDNVLNGGAGADSMSGGIGNDAYVVDNIGDIVVENSSEGTDSVLSSVTCVLSGNVENLILTGNASINGTGNALDNVLTGNFGANVLNGEAGTDVLVGAGGTDTLIGGTGDDNYVVIDNSSTLIENVNEGTDTVQSFVTHSLGANFENLTLLGSAAINGTGNSLNNILAGNSAKNTLSGKAGDDIYIIAGTDVVSEVANEGIDLVKIGSTYTLGANVEALNLTGTSALNGTGNTLANLLIGNSAVNTLNGSGGNDLLQGLGGNDALTDTSGNHLFDGGLGADTLTGGAGNELFIGGAGNDTITSGSGADLIAFNRGDGADTLNASTGADNTVSLGGGIKYADLTFSKGGNNLILNAGTGESVTFKDWYVGTSNKSVVTLQMVAEAMSDFDAAGSDPLKDDKIETFDFDGLVDRFDQSGVVSNWSLSNALLDFHISGSDTEALGGDLAYQYGKNTSLTGIGYGAAQGLVGSSQFGTAPQTLQPLTSLQEGVVKLA